MRIQPGDRTKGQLGEIMGTPTSRPSLLSGESQTDSEFAEADASGLEPESEVTPEIEVPFDPTKIDIIVKPMTISTLENRLENGELDLSPEFQRQANVWNFKRKARLIESILLRIPLPSFYFSEDENGTYAVVDGLQRLCAIFHFKNAAQLSLATEADLSPLHLRELQYLKDLENKTYHSLDRKFQRRISELEITANIIRANTPPAVKFNVFARLNQGGMPLNAQEIRNAIFPGVWRKHLREMAESAIFHKVTEGKVGTERQQDIELVLRYVALLQLGKPFQRPANQTLDEFLNSVVEHRLTSWDEDQWRRTKHSFERALRIASSLFGRHVFRKSIGANRRRPINRGLFESQLLVCSLLTDDQVETLIESRDRLEELFGEALEFDFDFSEALLYATGSAGASITRINTIAKIVTEVLNARPA